VARSFIAVALAPPWGLLGGRARHFVALDDAARVWHALSGMAATEGAVPRRDRTGIGGLLENLVARVQRLVRRQVRGALARHVHDLKVEIADLRRDAARLRRRLDLAEPRRTRPPRPCKVPGCPELHIAHGFCKNHYQQVRYREMKKAEAKQLGRTFPVLTRGKKRPGRRPKVPLVVSRS